MPKVLIVEDDADLRRLLQHRLEHAGYAVEEAVTGEGALRLLSKEEYALVILDVHLPGISGWEVARRISENPRIAQTPILFASVAERDDAPSDLIVKGWLAKPFTSRSLEAAIEEMASGSG